MDNPKRFRGSSRVARMVVGGVSVVCLAAGRWYVTASAFYAACMVAAVVYGALMEGGEQGGSDGSG